MKVTYLNDLDGRRVAAWWTEVAMRCGHRTDGVVDHLQSDLDVGAFVSSSAVFGASRSL
jgi:hypothetical protein